MNSTAKQTGQTTRDLAQKIARQIAQEPLEVLRTAKEQVSDTEAPAQPGPEQGQNKNQQRNLQEQQKLQDTLKTTRRMEALNQELKDIHKQDLFKDLQAKIAQGIEIPLEDYAELSMEQKQVLKAQMEAVKFQKQQAAYAQSQEGFKTPTSKKGRRFGETRKEEAQREQTHVEKPVPPSG
ncbi:MAG: hypothetical protein ABSE04_03965 [Candidatus Microgenomates bacterium]|jgi:hypothetical protein